jgi:putative oxidoreductase
VSRWKQFVFGAADGIPSRTELGLLLLRLFAGLSMAFAHGLGKLPPSGRFLNMVESLHLPAPVFLAWAAAVAEGVGGIFLAAGFLTRVAALAILVTMLTAAFGHHAGDAFPEKELALLYAAAMLPFVFAGSGKVGVDTLFRKG